MMLRSVLLSDVPVVGGSRWLERSHGRRIRADACNLPSATLESSGIGFITRVINFAYIGNLIGVRAEVVVHGCGCTRDAGTVHQ